MRQLSLFCLILFLLSCSEGTIFDKQQPCEKNNEGTVKVINSSSNPYYIYVDSDYIKTVLGRSSTVITVKAGIDRQMNAEQKSGYFLFPTKVDEKLNVIACGETAWFIP